MEPFWTPRGTQQSEKSRKVLSETAIFTPFEKHLEIWWFLDPPEPAGLSSHPHKTSIFACWPYPENVIKMTSQNLPFGGLWAPNGPKVQKKCPLENTWKNILQKTPKKCQNYLQNEKVPINFWPPFTSFFQLWPPERPGHLKYPKIYNLALIFAATAKREIETMPAFRHVFTHEKSLVQS